MSVFENNDSHHPIPLSQIRLTIDSTFLPHALQVLKSIGILHSFTLPCRQATLREAHSIFGFNSKMSLVANRSEICTFYLPLDCEDVVLSILSNELRLKLPGRGNLFSQPVNIISDNFQFFNKRKLKALPKAKIKSFDYNLISAIVPLGKADLIADSVLKLGLCVPTIYFGEGVGLRNKLGLIRITIPSDKEIAWFLVPVADSSILTRLVIQIGELHQPGQGILYCEEVKAYNVNMNLYHAKHRHLASMDQIIAALDEMHGSTEWRIKTSNTNPLHHIHRKSQPHNYCNLSLISNEGSASTAIATAMSQGAGGATLSQAECKHHDDVDNNAFHASKETCDLILRSDQLDSIIQSIIATGFLNDAASGLLTIKSVSDFLINKYYNKHNESCPHSPAN